MTRRREGEEREIKIDILKQVLHDDAVWPHSIHIQTILSGVAKHEREVVARWIQELCKNPDCPLDYHSTEMIRLSYKSRQAARDFIRDLEGDPWYFEELD